jgi:hypothetical protein
VIIRPEEELGFEQADEEPGFDESQNEQVIKRKRSPAVVTRVVGDLMVFIEVKDDNHFVGLVFKPNKIEGYSGQSLDELGVFLGTSIPEVVWDSHSLKVFSVTLQARSTATQQARA